MAAAVKHPWFFETDTPANALAGRGLLEHYLADHGSGDLFAASIVYGELLSNVVKHAPPGGVRVWLERESGGYTLCMRDSGHGFDPNALSKTPDGNAESGRGLFIIRRMCRGLSFKRTPGGFVVRALLPA